MMRRVGLLSRVVGSAICQRAYVSNYSPVASTASSDDQERMSEAMKKYMSDTEEFEKSVAKQRRMYEEGVQSLAVIMDKDPADMTEKDIKDAVAYLFPSSLYSSRARPKLIPPEESHPARKSLQCSLDGRPLQSLFYTRKPNFYSIMSKAASILYELEEMEDQLRMKKETPKKAAKLRFLETEWMTLKELQQMTLEKVTEEDYSQMMMLFERITRHPLSSMAGEFINQYRLKRYISETATSPPKIQIDEATGRRFAEGYGQRKRAFAEVRLWLDGTGKITVNNDRLLHAFPNIGDREQLLTPLVFTRQLGKLDVEVKTTGEGSSSLSGAGRLAIARALTSVVDGEISERMRLGGLLTPDMRFNEKKKGGLHGARKRFIWKRR